MKRQNDLSKIKKTIMLPIYIYTAISATYILMLLFLPMSISRKDVISYGRTNIITYGLIVIILLENLRIRGYMERSLPFIIVGFGGKFIQIVMFVLLFKCKKIYFMSMLVLLLFELGLTFLAFTDSKSYRYKKEVETIEDND